MKDILCHREQRYVSAQLTISYDRKQIILERNEVTEELAGKYVELYDLPDRPLELRWTGTALPYRVFNKDQPCLSRSALKGNYAVRKALARLHAHRSGNAADWSLSATLAE